MSKIGVVAGAGIAMLGTVVANVGFALIEWGYRLAGDTKVAWRTALSGEPLRAGRAAAHEGLALTLGVLDLTADCGAIEAACTRPSPVRADHAGPQAQEAEEG